MALAANAGYLNGAADATIAGTFTGTGGEIVIGGRNNNGTLEPGRYTGNVAAAAIYSEALSAAEVATVSAAMSLL